jgi:hypothetical protein
VDCLVDLVPGKVLVLDDGLFGFGCGDGDKGMETVFVGHESEGVVVNGVIEILGVS